MIKGNVMAQEQTDIELYDIYGVWHIPFWQTTIFYAILVGCTIVVCSVLFYYFYRWYKKRVQKVPYWVISQEALDKLSTSSLNNVDCADLFYSHLLVILKQHLSTHFNCDFTSATDQECIKLLRCTSNDDMLCGTMEEMLERTVTIRFARDAALKESMQNDLQKMYAIVQSMKQQSPTQ